MELQTRVDEVAERIYRFSTWIDIGIPGGFTFNQFLVDAEQPLLFHCGMRALFPLVSEALRRVIPLDKLRWISFGHVEADECGAMNQWLAAAPQARVVHGTTGCNVSINDLADRPPRVLDDGATLDLGGRRVRMLTTAHVPHGWESIVWHEETTATLLCGDIVTTAGNGPAVVEDDVAEAVLGAERTFSAWSLAPGSEAILERLAALRPRTLAAMHGSSYRGDGARVLRAIARGLAALAEARRREGFPAK